MVLRINLIGANAILGVSLAVAKAAADTVRQPLYRYVGGTNVGVLPVPMMNILGGGSHADNKIDIQEFMVLPVGASTFSEGLRMGTEIFHSLKSVLRDKDHSTNVGDEGSFAPNLGSNEEGAEFVLRQLKTQATSLVTMFFLHLTQQHQNSSIRRADCTDLTRQERRELATRWLSFGLTGEQNILSFLLRMVLMRMIGLVWKKLTDKIGENTQLVGDDLFVTNVKRLSQGIDQGVGNSLLVKVNQIGTLSETIDAVEIFIEQVTLL